MNTTLTIPETTRKLIIEQTPKKYIKTRPGAYGKALSYVETGYVIQKLNEIFAYNWSFEIMEQTIGKKQVFVKGRLTGNFPTPDGKFFAIVKEQYGGIDIKFPKGGNGDAISIADDLKAAGSDALKKCASMFGIAADVFWPSGEYESHLDGLEESPDTELEADNTPIRQVEDEKPIKQLDFVDPYKEKSVGALKVQISQLMHKGKIKEDYAMLSKMTRSDCEQLLSSI